MTEFRSWEDYARAMTARANQMPGAFREGTTKATAIAHAKSKEHMRELIYGKPEDKTGSSFKRKDRGTLVERFEVRGGKRVRSKTGRKKWRRTGQLRREEKQRVVSDTEGQLYNDAAHALHRHDLGLRAGNPEAIRGSRRKSRRIAPWRKRAIADTVEQRRQAYRDPIWQALTRR